MPTDTLVIVNPMSRGGRRGRTRRWIEALVRDRLPGAEIATTRGPHDAGRLACEAAAGGATRIIVAGGDGSASEVASGLLGADLSRNVSLGILPLGTGRDFARGLGVAELRSAVECIVAGKTRALDAGCLRFADGHPDGREGFFVNVASAGLSAEVVRCVDGRMKARFGQAAFACGFIKALRAWNPVRGEVWVDGECVARGPLDMVAVANGSFFGGGMQLAPGAAPDDGLFDVVSVRAMSTGQWLRRMPQVYRGRHLHYPEVDHCRGRVVEIRGAGGPAFPLELDGEELKVRPSAERGAQGHGRVVFEILPRVLSVMVPADR